MPQEINQDMPQENPDEAAALLSFATNLSQQTMPKKPQTEKQPQGGADRKQLNEFKNEVGSMIDEKLGGIAKLIEEALKEDGK